MRSAIILYFQSFLLVRTRPTIFWFNEIILRSLERLMYIIHKNLVCEILSIKSYEGTNKDPYLVYVYNFSPNMKKNLKLAYK